MFGQWTKDCAFLLSDELCTYSREHPLRSVSVVPIHALYIVAIYHYPSVLLTGISRVIGTPLNGMCNGSVAWLQTVRLIIREEYQLITKGKVDEGTHFLMSRQ